MLIEFKVANYRSFRDEQTFSMVASRDATHPYNLIDCDGFSVTKAAAVYGPNASGKSNLIKAMSAMERLVLTSATKMNLGDRIDVSPFRLDSATLNQPSRFEVTVLLDGVTYVYGFSATTDRVHDEWLHVRRAGGRQTPWFERSFDPQTQQTDWQIKGPLKRDAELLQSRTRDNGLLLSRGAELNVELFAPLFLWFLKGLRILDLSFPPIDVGQETARRISKNEDLQSRVLQLVRDADFGITGIRVTGFIQRTLFDFDEVSDELVDLYVLTEHAMHSTGEVVRFSLKYDESNGTQRFFALAGPILDGLSAGMLLAIDEFDCSMHPLLTRKLVELFQSDVNTTGAQLVFATHDSSIMDASLFRRDQIWLTEKRQDGSTDLFSLYDIDSEVRPRKSEALEKNYLAGRYGGVPKFGPTFEDLEIR
jgi:AAA15 family ATPase/GTPase